jgi:hypothetical protein
MFVTCPDPECEAPAEMFDPVRLGSTSGPMLLVRTYCVRRHIFLLPAEQVPGADTTLAPARSAAHRETTSIKP